MFLVRLRRMGWFSLARAAVRDDNSILGRVGAAWVLFPIHGGDGPARAGAHSLETSRFNGARIGRYVYTVESVQGLRPPAVDVFRVELADRRAGFSGKRSRRPTPWASKT